MVENIMIIVSPLFFDGHDYHTWFDQPPMASLPRVPGAQSAAG